MKCIVEYVFLFTLFSFLFLAGGVVEAGVTCEPLVAASGSYATPGGASTSTSFQHVPPYDLRGRKSPLHLHDASTAGFNATAPVHPTATRPTSPTASATASVLQSAATPPLSQPARKRLRRNTSCTITSSDSKSNCVIQVRSECLTVASNGFCWFFDGRAKLNS